MSTLMNPQELARRFKNYQSAHGKIYHNNALIYGNDVPIYDSIESELTYILDLSPDTYEKIQKYICKAKYTATGIAGQAAWEEIKEYCPEDCHKYVEVIGSFLFDVLTP